MPRRSRNGSAGGGSGPVFIVCRPAVRLLITVSAYGCRSQGVPRDIAAAGLHGRGQPDRGLAPVAVVVMVRDDGGAGIGGIAPLLLLYDVAKPVVEDLLLDVSESVAVTGSVGGGVCPYGYAAPPDLLGR